MPPRFFSRSSILAALACLGLALPNGRAIASITIQAVDIAAYARAFSGADVQHFTNSVIPTPTPTALNAERDFDSWYGISKNTIEFSENSGQTILSVTIDSHKRDGRSTAGTYAGAGYGGLGEPGLQGLQGLPLKFTTDVDTPYELSGVYEANGDANRVGQFAQLWDVGTNQVLFKSEQISENTPNEAFTLGGGGGDTTNVLTGSLTGDLLAGHTYAWAFYANTAENSRALNSASGNFKLVLGEFTDTGDSGAVPEANSFLIWGLLGLTVAGCGSRRREGESRIAYTGS